MKAKTGRKAGFNRATIVGTNPAAIGFTAYHGNAVATQGAKLAQKYLGAVMNSRLFPEIPKFEAERRTVADEIAAAVSGFKPMLLRQIADYLEAIRSGGATGPADQVLVHADNFIRLCRGPRPMGKTSKSLSGIVQNNTELSHANQRPPFTPSIKEIHGYLCYMIDDNVAYKTASRAAKFLGIKGGTV